MVNYRNYGFSITNIPRELREGGECINHLPDYFRDSQRTGYRGRVADVVKIRYLLESTALISLNSKKFCSAAKVLPNIPSKLSGEDGSLLHDFCSILSNKIVAKEYTI